MPLTNIAWISANNHDPKNAAAAAIDNTGRLYTWGNNDKDMISHPAAFATVNTPTTPPGFTVGVDIAKSVEVGGHTIVYIKSGSDRYCYTGHHVAGSMGDGTSTDAVAATADCASTGAISPVCGVTSEDFGDAPSSYDALSPAHNYYATSYNNNAANYLCLGTKLPGEETASKMVIGGTTCNSPKGDGIEEDGVTSFPVLAGGHAGQTIATYSVNVFVHNTMGAAATVGGWIDWNCNGVFETGEGVTANVPNGTNGTITLIWHSQILTGPNGTAATYARLRVTTAADGLTTADFGGGKNFGEVEDYYIPFITVLPVTLTSLTAVASKCTAIISWQTSLEINVDHFEIEISGNGSNYTLAAIVASKNISSGSAYSSKVNALSSGANYFRLVSIDNNEKKAYSNVVSIKNACEATIVMSPNPAKDVLLISGLEGTNTIWITNEMGQQVASVRTVGANERVNISRFTRGSYFVRIFNNSGGQTNLKFIKE